MSIAAICTRNLVTADRELSLREAAQLMRDRHVGALVVTAAGSTQVVGIVTDRDLVIDVLARDLDPGRVTIGHLINTNLVAVPLEAGLGEAVATMRDEGIRRLLIVDKKCALVGIVTIDDIIEAISGELTDLAAALRAGPAREGSPNGIPLSAPPGAPTLPSQALAARWHQVTAP